MSGERWRGGGSPVSKRQRRGPREGVGAQRQKEK